MPKGLNKQQFTDAISTRYSWEIDSTPANCASTAKTLMDHSLICKLDTISWQTLRHGLWKRSAEMFSQKPYLLKSQTPS